MTTVLSKLTVVAETTTHLTEGVYESLVSIKSQTAKWYTSESMINYLKRRSKIFYRGEGCVKYRTLQTKNCTQRSPLNFKVNAQ